MDAIAEYLVPSPCQRVLWLRISLAGTSISRAAGRSPRSYIAIPLKLENAKDISPSRSEDKFLPAKGAFY